MKNRRHKTRSFEMEEEEVKLPEFVLICPEDQSYNGSEVYWPWIHVEEPMQDPLAPSPILHHQEFSIKREVNCDSISENIEEAMNIAHKKEEEVQELKKGETEELNPAKQIEAKELGFSFSNTTVQQKCSKIVIHHKGAFSCEDCGKSYRSVSAFASHRQTHIPMRTNECSICKKHYCRISNLMKHVKSHKENSSLRNSVEKENSSQHESSHPVHYNSIHKLHTCSVCKMSFPQSTHLYQHMNVHSMSYLLYCDFCKKSFRDKRYLAHHIRFTHLGFNTLVLSATKR